MSFNVVPFRGLQNDRPAADLWFSLSADLIERYIDVQCVAHGLGQSARQSYREDLRSLDTWMREMLGRTLITAHARDITRYFNTCATSSMATRTIMRALSSLRGFYRFLREGGIRSDDPVEQMLESLHASHRPFLASCGRTALQMP